MINCMKHTIGLDVQSDSDTNRNMTLSLYNTQAIELIDKAK